MRASLFGTLLFLAPLAGLAAPCTELPVLHIVQDKSGSMADAPDGTAPTLSNPSKWDIASSVVPSIAQQFQNRFRYGVGMFPGASTTFACATGGTVSAVPSTASDVQWAYAGALPGGGTPTAATLRATKTYLQSVALGGAPAYVLLITDGMPNCNTSLDAATCTSSTPGCQNTSTCSGSTCCGLGSKDCLDNLAATQAAGELKAAGFKVYVVGFGSTLSTGNNKAVLDAIASAGGTGSAYTASNQTALTSALNTIAQSTAQCCQNACTQGATQCSGTGVKQTCQLDAVVGCTSWVSTSCPSMSVCTAGTCQACSNACTLGSTRCTSGNVEQCVAGAGGCTVWTTAQTCNYGELCSNGSCNSCQGCSIGASRCTASGVEECSWNVLSGCTQWVSKSCGSGSVCQNGSCAACNGTCTPGSTQCAGKNAQTCVADAHGCTSWQTTQSCTSFCSGGACGTCGPTCTAGATRCNGNGVETCAADANGCTTWGPAAACGANRYCAGGACKACGTTCTPGVKRCAANGMIEQCGTDAATGCTVWGPVAQCYLAGGERCDTGVCIPPCQDQCTEGGLMCVNGRPQACLRQATGCTLWQDQDACAVDQLCVGGVCRGKCAADEVETCPGTLVCTGVPGTGRVCLPPGGTGGGSGSGGGAGTGGAGAGGSSGTGGGSGAGGGGLGTGGGAGTGGTHGAQPGDGGSIGAQASGCGCSSFDGSALSLAAAAVLAARSRRARRW